jgi:hypothetical protein
MMPATIIVARLRSLGQGLGALVGKLVIECLLHIV